jgi:hypothetical protein
VSFSGPGQDRPTLSGSTSVAADQDGIRSEVQGGVCTTTNFSIGGYVYAQNQCGSVMVPLHDGNETVVASYNGSAIVGTSQHSALGTLLSQSGTNMTIGFEGGDTSVAPAFTDYGGSFYDPSTGSSPEMGTPWALRGELVGPNIVDPSYLWDRLTHSDRRQLELAMLFLSTYFWFLDVNHYSHHPLLATGVSLLFSGLVEGAFAAGVVACRHREYLDIYYHTVKVFSWESYPLYATYACGGRKD